MNKESLIGAAIVITLSTASLIFWITRPAKCPRCCEKYDERNVRMRPNETTCGRCGTHYNPITGQRI